MTSIGDAAFYGCSSLKEVYVENPTPPNIGYGSFDSDKTTSKVLYVPTASVNDYKVSAWSNFFNNIRGYTPSGGNAANIGDRK